MASSRDRRCLVAFRLAFVIGLVSQVVFGVAEPRAAARG